MVRNLLLFLTEVALFLQDDSDVDSEHKVHGKPIPDGTRKSVSDRL